MFAQPALPSTSVAQEHTPRAKTLVFAIFALLSMPPVAQYVAMAPVSVILYVKPPQR
jgi:hypothetical protein